ncbi:DUF192 domain-containing protein [Candidatus Microgenomates bacterium]|nr:DUF192 domain-containing protein [Candidatus Microgenomates bacterium]
MKYLFYSLVPISIVVFLLLFIFRSSSVTGNSKTVIINGNPIQVEIADNDALRTQGLSGRKSLATNSGMLFIYPKAGIYSFWMKEMQFPLDFIWINGDTVADLMKDVPAPETNDLLVLSTYQSNTPVDKALELNAGSIDRLTIKIGDKIKY